MEEELLQEQMFALFEAEAHSDIEFQADGKTFKLHKAILDARCPNIFQHIDVSRVPSSSLSSLLEFVYTDSCSIASWTDAAHVLALAKKLQLEGLEALCMNEIIDSFDPSSFAETLKVALDNGLDQVIDHFVWFYMENVENIPADAEIPYSFMRKLVLQSKTSAVKPASPLDHPPYTLADDLKRMMEEGKHCDFVIELDDGTEIKCHKCILSARSEYFEAMLANDMQETREGRCKLMSEMGAETFEKMISFLYCGDMSTLTSVDALRLLAEADYFLIHSESFIEQCQQIAAIGLDVEACLEVFVLARTHGHDELKKKALDVITQNKHILMPQIKDIQDREAVIEILLALSGM